MRVAFICPISLTSPGGATQRIRRLVSRFREYGEIHFISLGKDAECPKDLVVDHFHAIANHSFPDYLEPIGLFKRKARAVLCNRLGFEKPIDFWFDESWEPQLKQIAGQFTFDLVIAEYVFASKALRYFRSAHKVIDTHDIFHRRTEFIGEKENGWFQCNRAAREAAGWRRADTILGIQEKETETIRQFVPDRRAMTLGHPLELDFCYDSSVENTIGLISSNSVSNQIAAKWFIAGPLQSIRASRPQTRLLLAGSICKSIPDGPGIEKIGFVDALRDFYSQVSFAINPITQGTGLKIKTVEAIEHGCPILSTEVGLEGLESLQGKGITLCEDETQWALNITSLLASKAKRKESAKLTEKAALHYLKQVLSDLETFAN